MYACVYGCFECESVPCVKLRLFVCMFRSMLVLLIVYLSTSLTVSLSAWQRRARDNQTFKSVAADGLDMCMHLVWLFFCEHIDWFVVRFHVQLISSGSYNVVWAMHQIVLFFLISKVICQILHFVVLCYIAAYRTCFIVCFLHAPLIHVFRQEVVVLVCLGIHVLTWNISSLPLKQRFAGCFCETVCGSSCLCFWIHPVMRPNVQWCFTTIWQTNRSQVTKREHVIPMRICEILLFDHLSQYLPECRCKNLRWVSVGSIDRIIWIPHWCIGVNRRNSHGWEHRMQIVKRKQCFVHIQQNVFIL